MLPKRAITEYQKIYLRIYKKNLTFKDAEEEANRLFYLFKKIFKPGVRQNPSLK
ncbi:MAG: hypothetical protein WC489_01970 [Patescibacteria group bacterium]